MTDSFVSADSPNRRTARFYDRVAWLYPLVDWFCRHGRRRLIEHINREPRGRVLEIGVGPGGHLHHYRGHEVIAIDCSPAMIERCRRCAPGVAAHVMDGERLTFASASFDYVVLCHVLSVTAHPERMLAEARRIVRPGGRIFVLNHETPANAWSHLERLAAPLARLLCFRSVFRVAQIPGAAGFRVQLLEARSGCGLMNAYRLEP